MKFIPKAVIIFLYFTLTIISLLPKQVFAIKIQPIDNINLTFNSGTLYYPRNFNQMKKLSSIHYTKKISISYTSLPLSICDNSQLEAILTLNSALQVSNLGLVDGHTVYVFNQSDSIGYIIDFTLENETTKVIDQLDQPIKPTKLLIDYNTLAPIHNRKKNSCDWTPTISIDVYPIILQPSSYTAPIAITKKLATVNLTANRIALALNPFLNQEDTHSFNINITPPTIITKPYTCTLNNPNQTVYLDDISVKDLLSGNANNINSGNFTLQLDCPDNTNPISQGSDLIQLNNIYATLFDNNARDSNDSEILTLLTNGERNPSVGLRLIRTDNNQVIKYGINNQWLFATNAHGTKPSVSFNVRYVPLQTPVVPGKVTGTATITFSYQ